MKSKQSKILLCIVIVITLVISFTGGFLAHYLVQGKTNRLLGEILAIMETNAVNPNGDNLEFESEEVAREFVNSLLKDDDYATYYSNKELEEIINEGEGNYSGFGIALYADYPYVYQTIGNSPAYKAGLKQDDRIVKAKRLGDQGFTAFSTTDQLIDFFDKIAEGERVEMVVDRAGEEINLTLSKEEYVATYVEYFDNQNALRFVSDFGEQPRMQIFSEGKMQELDDDTAMIVFTEFSGTSAGQLSEALDYFYQSGKSKLIFDLRRNGGGYMECLVKVASNFINNGGKTKNLITRVEERNGYSEYFTRQNNFDDRLKKIVVLADEGTASASESLIGAMLYYQDGGFSMDSLLINYNKERENYSTYGKGIMQTTYKLISGGAIKLTTAKIYQPDLKTCIHGKGIVQANPLNQVSDATALARAVEILSAS